jgi:hypothetical protein
LWCLIKCACDPDLYAEWRDATAAPKHVHHDGDNITIKPERGTALPYTLSRLKRDEPKLFAKVGAAVVPREAHGDGPTAA